MAKITDEMKEQINELYYQNHNKSLTARTLGISAASVTRYLIPNYVPLSERKEIIFDKPVGNADELISVLHCARSGNLRETLVDYCTMTPEEKADFDTLRKEFCYS